MATTIPPPSAVSRVFALPELCEKIFSQLGEGELLHGVPTTAPVLDLFTVWQVDRFFRAVVQGSPTLQRMMWLRATDKPNEDLVGNNDLRRLRIAALTWLHSHLADDLSESGAVGTTNPDVNPDNDNDTITNDTVFLPPAWPAGAFLAAEASWRKMQALNVHTGRRAEFTVWFSEHWQPVSDGDPGMEGYEELLELREGETLERVLDKIQQVDRDRPGHQRAVDGVLPRDWLDD